MGIGRSWGAAKGDRPNPPYRLNGGSPQTKGLVACFPFGMGYTDNRNLAPTRPNVGIAGGYGSSPLFNHRSVRVQTAATDGLDAVTIAGLLSGSEGTFSAWVQCDDASNTQDILNYRFDGNNEIEITDFHGNFGLPIRFIHRGNSTANQITLTSLAAAEIAQFTYTWSVSANSCSAYKNGIPTTQASNVVAFTSAATANAIGNNTAFNGGWLGKLWHVLYYNRAIAPQEAWALWEPGSRWDLYAVPSTRTFFDMAAAAAAARANRLALLGVA